MSGSDGVCLVQRYEELRDRALGGGGGGFPMGLGLLMGKGLSAWMRAARTLPAPTTPRATVAPAPPDTVTVELVRVLAAMAVACVGSS